MSRNRKVRRRLYNLKRNESAIYESRFAPCFSDYQIEFCIRNLLKIAKKSKTHFCVTFLGFDHDERELYEIPEANELYLALLKSPNLCLIEKHNLLVGQRRSGILYLLFSWSVFQFSCKCCFWLVS